MIAYASDKLLMIGVLPTNIINEGRSTVRGGKQNVPSQSPSVYSLQFRHSARDTRLFVSNVLRFIQDDTVPLGLSMSE